VQKSITSLIDRVAKGELKVVIDREFPLSKPPPRTPTSKAVRLSAGCC
jgi:hypothetical protein